MKLDEKTIQEIASELAIGMVCFLNKETGTPKFVIDVNDPFAESIELWKEDLDEIERNREQYVKIEKMSSNDAYNIMVDFTETIKDKAIQERLFHALNQNKPFKKFNYVVDYNEALRQAWFKFHDRQYIEWVKKVFEYIE